MNRFHLPRPRRRRPTLPRLDPAFSPWFRFETDDDFDDLFIRLKDVGPVPGEIVTRANSTLVTGRLSARQDTYFAGGCGAGLTISGEDGENAQIENDILAFRFRLDAPGSTDMLRSIWDSILERIPLLGFHLDTGELRTGLPVGFDIDDWAALTAPTASWVHLLPVPLEALNTEEIWTMVRLAMYHEAGRFRDEWVRNRHFNNGYLDGYYLGDGVRAISWLEIDGDASYWETSAVPAFGLARPVSETTRLWFADDAGRAFRCTHGEIDEPELPPAYRGELIEW